MLLLYSIEMPCYVYNLSQRPLTMKLRLPSTYYTLLNTQNTMVKMVEVQEDRFGRVKGSARRHISLPDDEESLYTETEKDGELIPYGTHSGLLENKGIQDRLVSEYAAKHADLVAKHEAEQARVTTDPVAKHEAEQSNSHAEQARITADYAADVGVLSDGGSTTNQPSNPKTSGAVDPTMSEEPGYLTKQMDSMIADSSSRSSENVSSWV